MIDRLLGLNGTFGDQQLNHKLSAFRSERQNLIKSKSRNALYKLPIPLNLRWHSRFQGFVDI